MLECCSYTVELPCTSRKQIPISTLHSIGFRRDREKTPYKLNVTVPFYFNMLNLSASTRWQYRAIQRYLWLIKHLIVRNTQCLSFYS